MLQFAHPLFKVNNFKTKQFLNVLSFKLRAMKNAHEWSPQEKDIVDDTVVRFNKMSKLKIYENQYINDINTSTHKQNFYSNTNNYYSNKKPYNEHNKWQKKSNQKPCTSTSINQNYDHEKYSTSNKEPSYHKLKTKHDLIKPLKNSSNEISESMLSLNDSNSIDSKFKKFERKHNSLDDIHVVSMERNSAFLPSHIKTHSRGNSQNRQNRFQNQGKLLRNRENYNNFKHSHGGHKWPVPRQNNNDQNLKNSDTNENKKQCKQNVDDTDSQIHKNCSHSKSKRIYKFA